MSLEDKINSVIGTAYDYKEANCWDLVMLLNENAPKLDTVHESVLSTKVKFNNYLEEHKPDFNYVLFGKDGDIVLLGNGEIEHAGIFYSEGVVHASKNGVVWQPLSIIKRLYRTQKAYRWKH